MGTTSGPVLALAGGVGGAKLALGLSKVLPPDRLVIVVNTGDDEEFHGLHVSPDLDTVMYTLAGLANPDTGWGLAGESFQTLEMLSNYGAPTWFNLGDKDLATHIRRTQLLSQGWSLSQVTQELCQRLGIEHAVVPMSDDEVRTVVDTDDGPLAFQEYFVHRHCEPRTRAVSFHGAEVAKPSPTFDTALRSASALVFCPSNPFLSIDPILAVGDVRERILSFKGPRVTVSPIVGGAALRGPAAKMLEELGHPVSCVGVARQYRGLCDLFVLDQADNAHADAIQSLGMEPHVTNTIMNTDEDKIALAKFIRRLLER
ncbi:MAG: 2-phospho-L-lactate transferase [Dehalococcoidia bacterium]